MQQRKVWRYYCDHCRKGGCGKGAMAKHERHCVKNPNRKCRMCDAGETVQQPLVDLLDALRSGGIDRLREVADGCPACMLHAVVMHNQTEPEYEPETGAGGGVYFDFKSELKQFWERVNESERQWRRAYL